MPKNNLLKTLLERKVPQIIVSYIVASTSMVLFLDWLKINYGFPKEYITLALFGAVSIMPSVIILAYFHGAPGKDEWTKIATSYYNFTSNLTKCRVNRFNQWNILT